MTALSQKRNGLFAITAIEILTYGENRRAARALAQPLLKQVISRLIDNPEDYHFSQTFQSELSFSPLSASGGIVAAGRAGDIKGGSSTMVRMDHFRGILFEGDRILLDSVEGYLAFHENREGRRRWFGHIELSSDKQALLVSGVRYRLALDDGRDGFIYADIHDGNQPGQHVAEFQVTGEFRGKPSRAFF